MNGIHFFFGPQEKFLYRLYMGFVFFTSVFDIFMKRTVNTDGLLAGTSFPATFLVILSASFFTGPYSILTTDAFQH